MEQVGVEHSGGGVEWGGVEWGWSIVGVEHSGGGA